MPTRCQPCCIFAHSVHNFSPNNSGELWSWMGFSSFTRNSLCSIMIFCLGDCSGDCLPTYLFFRFSGKGCCSTMISWFLVVPGKVPILLLLLISSFVSQDRDAVPQWVPASFWFRLGFRCLSPCFFVLSFLRKEMMFHLDFLVSFVPSKVAVFVSLLFSSFFSPEKGSVPSWFPGSSWFRLKFEGLSPGVGFHHDVLVPPGSGSGCSACAPSSSFFAFSQELGFCAATIAWFRLYLRFLCSFFDFTSGQRILIWMDQGKY